MKRLIHILSISLMLMVLSTMVYGQKLSEETFKGLKFRSIGPAFTSGRIADIAIHPTNENIWYIAVGSGGVWKTTNAGTTWKSIFDEQKSYSIGCITIDPNNASTIWVGSGENVGGRHTGFGDGVYMSSDEGMTWKNMGLQKSEHISKIIVHPNDPNTIWIAAQGPLWSKGGERGVYKSTDGGKSWNRTLGDSEWTGATDLLIDPRDANTLYAATWQRHRTVAAYMGGGPKSGIHKSTDGGQTWVKLSNGIPNVNLGKIGLTMSHFNSDKIYAAIELERITGGVFMTSNGGASWTKQSDAVSGGTGPHYYQELYASPHQVGRLYLMNNVVKISDDHGKTFRNMNEKNKHVDSHAMAFKSKDPNYLLFGTDGGLYETYDLTKTWRFIRNLPLTQYYKIAVDDSAPFYNIYGGTQDNGSHGGPSRTANQGGILNSDWWITLAADGHQSAIEPDNPDITYGEFQEGWLWRIDQTTGETVYIQPQPAEGETYERFNWDAPILVSPHNPTRLYFASQRVWKSENRGDDWTAISKDLTKNQERLALPIMGSQQSWDNSWDVNAMSNYNTITSLTESPKKEGLLYVGTDDGIIQVTENGGSSWKKIELSSVKGIPATAFVNDIRADLFDENIVYAALDNHKYGDYSPYLIKSTNKGTTWTLMNGDLPKSLITWRLVQDHVNKNLLFAATEFGVYFTTNNGTNWVKLSGNMPNISLRDIAIQRRENDLVVGSFGRGIFILDDISPIRNFTSDIVNKPATLFPVKDAYWYVQKGEIYGRGDAEYKGDNAPFGAAFTYYLSDKLKSLKEVRKEKEKGKTSIPFPGWDSLAKEKNQEKPTVLLTIKDKAGNIINTIRGLNEKGFNRINWDLSFADRSGVPLTPPPPVDDYFNFGYKATPGEYTVSMSQVIDGVTTELSSPQTFKIVPLRKGALKGKSYDEIAAFRNKFEKFQQDINATQQILSKQMKRIDAFQRASNALKSSSVDLSKDIHATRERLLDLNTEMNGNSAKNEVGEKNEPTPWSASFVALVGLSSSTYGPTGTHKATLEVAMNQLKAIKSNLKTIVNTDMPQLRELLKKSGAPWIEGDPLLEE